MTGRAHAQTVTTFFDRTAWEATVTSPTSGFFTETFSTPGLSNGIALDSESVNADEAPGIGGGIFTDKVQPAATTIPLIGLSQPARTTTLTLPTALASTGFGGDFDLSPGGYGTGIFVTVNFVGGGSQDLGNIISDSMNSLGGDLQGFFGLRVTGGTVSSVAFDGGPAQSGLASLGGSSVENYSVDNLSVSAAVPEPGTVALAGLPLLGVAVATAVRRRRQGGAA